nr:hypothetical protein CFP56_22754 [Quercus suber]
MPPLYEGNTETRPYGEWLCAGYRTSSSRPRNTENSPPRHSPAPTSQMLRRDPRDTQTPDLTMIDVTGNTKLQGAVNANNCSGKTRIPGIEKDGPSPQITKKVPSDPDTLKPNPMDSNSTPLHTYHPHDSPH